MPVEKGDSMKKVYFILALILVMTLITSCGAGMSDWKLILPNNYEMWHINSKEIIIGYKDTESSLTTGRDGTTIGIKADVVEVCFNDRYVGAKQIDVQQDLKQEIDTSNPRYYLLDTLKREVYGPFTTINQFNKKCSELGVYHLSKWEKTRPAPRKAVFTE